MPACRVTCVLCAGECIGHAGVQMGKWSVHELRVVCRHAWLPLQADLSSAERGWMVPTQAVTEVPIRSRVQVLTVP